MVEPESARRAAESVHGIPRDASGPVFRAPWEAHAFAMALALHERGVFAWSEWSAMLGEEIKKAQAALRESEDLRRLAVVVLSNAPLDQHRLATAIADRLMQ